MLESVSFAAFVSEFILYVPSNGGEGDEKMQNIILTLSRIRNQH